MFEKAKELKIFKNINKSFFWSFGVFINWRKNVFNQPLPSLKNAVKFVIFFSTKMFIYIFFICVFFQTKKLKIYEGSYFSFFKDSMLLNVLKKSKLK